MAQPFVYRKEIDGLRAIAVISVILYHSGIEIFSQGYLGVDVFFVISGYLITSLVFNDLTNNRFNFLKFITRRARRILPLLFFVTFVSIPFCIYFLSPNLLENFSQSVIALNLFNSNILFWFTSGDYFDLKSELKPLIHTWSLCIEIQFYLIFPLVLLYFKKNIKLILFILFITSLSLSFLENYLYINSIDLFKTKSFGSFYLFHTRIWELLLGAAVYFLNDKLNNTKIKINLSIIGFSILLLSLFTNFFNISSVYAVNSLFSCIATSIILLSTNNKSNIINKLLCFRPLVFLGLISFSLYMWHQPIFSIFRIYNNNLNLSFLTLSILVPIIILLSFVTYRYIEKPYRNNFLISDAKFIKNISIIYIFTFILAVTILITGSFYKYEKYKKLYPSISFNGNDVGLQNLIRKKTLTSLTNKKIENINSNNINNNYLIVGFSHAEDFFISVNQVKELTAKYNFFYQGISYNEEGQYYFKLIRFLESIKEKKSFVNSKNIILDVDLSVLENDILKIDNFFKKYNKNLILLSPPIYFKVINDDPSVFSIHKWHLQNGFKDKLNTYQLNKIMYDLVDKEFFNVNKKILDNLSKNNIRFINKVEFSCPNYKNKTCYSLTDNYKKIYFDNTHLTLDGAKFFGSIIYKKKLLEKTN